MELIYTLLLWTVTLATVFGGRSFPMQAENETTDKFKQVNPRMEIDETNYLVDLSGLYSQCTVSQNQQSGEVRVTRKTADGATVYGMVDYMDGNGIDTDTVTSYIRSVMAKWTAPPPRGSRDGNPFLRQIQASNRYGCSVQPGCSGYVVVACMFSSV